MKYFKLFGLIMLFSTTLSAQYKNITVQKSDFPFLKILQIDFTEKNTFIHFQYTNTEPKDEFLSISEDYYIKDKETYKKYKLLNSINLPISYNNAFAVVNSGNHQHNFTLEFEKIPKSIGPFDIIENAANGFNFYDVRVDTTLKSKSFLDIGSFVSDTPLKERGSYFNEGKPVIFYNYKGLSLTVMLRGDNNYGKYYQANILISNRTGRDILINPLQITAEFSKDGKTEETEVLKYMEYMKKVNRRQTWAAIGNAIDEASNTLNAGYSTSTTNSSVNSSVSSSSSASGYVGDTYGSVSGSSLTYGSAYASSTTLNYDPAIAYAAKKESNRNIEDFNRKLDVISSTLSDNYLKLNTVKNGADYGGFVNIKFELVDHLIIRIPINGENYVFGF